MVNFNRCIDCGRAVSRATTKRCRDCDTVFRSLTKPPSINPPIDRTQATIYMLTQNGVPFYVGSSQDPKGRLSQHRGPCASRNIRAIARRGPIDLVELTVVPNDSDRQNQENAWIDQLRGEGYSLVNKNLAKTSDFIKDRTMKLELKDSRKMELPAPWLPIRKSVNHTGRPVSR